MTWSLVAGPQNLVIVRELDTPNNYGGITYLGFERLTYVPIQVSESGRTRVARCFVCVGLVI